MTSFERARRSHAFPGTLRGHEAEYRLTSAEELEERLRTALPTLVDAVRGREIWPQLRLKLLPPILPHCTKMHEAHFSCRAVLGPHGISQLLPAGTIGDWEGPAFCAGAAVRFPGLPTCLTTPRFLQPVQTTLESFSAVADAGRRRDTVLPITDIRVERVHTLKNNEVVPRALDNARLTDLGVTALLR